MYYQCKVLPNLKNKMNQNEITILNKLKNFHKGKDQAITYKDLARRTGINEREVRSSVAALVTCYQQPIASSSEAGYYFINSQEEFDHARNELMSRIKKLSRRIKGLRIGYQKSKQEVKPYQEVMF